MSFGENLSYYRKKLKITQEELAEKLFVTRQTVSRWETDNALPDVETLVKLCDLLSCDMDTLVRGNAKDDSIVQPPKPQVEYCNLADYDEHMNNFSLAIAVGVAAILLGVALMLTLFAFGYSVLGVIALLLFIAGAVTDFIIFGITHSNFMKNNPKAPEYPSNQKESFTKKFAISIAGATLLIFLAVIAFIIAGVNIDKLPDGAQKETFEYLSIALLIFLIGLSVFVYTYSGMIHEKYNVEEYNRECIEEGYAKENGEGEKIKPKHVKIDETVSSIIMMLATISFLLLGFLFNLWHPAWVIFPIGGILCGIASLFINAFTKNDNQ